MPQDESSSAQQPPTAATPVPYYLRPNKEQTEMNERMGEMLPELDSPWAVTPMVRGRWLKPDEQTDEGEPCFIATRSKKAGEVFSQKPNYIWMMGNKDMPPGYYHLATKEVYTKIYYLIRLQRPRYSWRRRHSYAKEKEMYDKIKNLIHNRLISEVPNDVHAQMLKVVRLQQKAGLASASGKAAHLPVLTSSTLIP